MVKKSLTLYFSSEIFLSLGIGVVMYAQPFLYKSAGLNDDLVGILFSVSSLVAGAAALLLGPVADRIGASVAFKTATALMGLSYVMLGFLSGFWPWIMTAVVSGVGVGLLTSTENVVLSSLTKGYEKAGILSKFVALYMLLISMGVILAGFLSSSIGFVHTVQIGAAITMVAPLIRWWVKAPDAKSDRLLRLPSKHVSMMALYAVLIGVAMGILNPFVTLILHNHFLLSNHFTSVVQAGAMLMTSLGAFLVSTMLRRFRYGPTLFLSFLFAIVFTAAMVWAGGAWWFAGGYLFRTVFLTMPGPIVDATFLDLSLESEFSQMFGTRVFGNNAGSAIGSYAGGVVLNHSWIGGLLAGSAVALILSYLYLMLLLKRMKHQQLMPPSSSEPLRPS